MTLRSVLLSFIIVSTSGCAFTPQAVRITPNVEVIAGDMGGGKTVHLNVADERPRQTLGTRGAGVGAELTVEGELKDIVRNALAEGMQKQGFKPVYEANPEDRELRVEIRNLDYQVITGFWAGTLRVSCGLKAICVRGTARPYEQLHSGMYESSLQVVQGAEANNGYVSDAVSKAVNSILRDVMLRNCLVQ